MTGMGFSGPIERMRVVGAETGPSLANDLLHLVGLRPGVRPLTMGWCLECHRQPERFLRPREYVFRMDWEPPIDQLTLGRQLVKEYRIRSAAVLTSCDMCHR